MTELPFALGPGFGTAVIFIGARAEPAVRLIHIKPVTLDWCQRTPKTAPEG